MTRDRTISAVFMAVLLVLASGTAVSLAVTGDSTTDAGTNAAALQETTTVVEDETTTAAAEETASVTIDEQASDGEEVVIESATLPEGGFIAIHSENWEDAPLASVLGNSVYLEPGTHEDVTITLARPVTSTQTLVAMPHLDTNDNQVYDFVLSTGELDGPYTEDDAPVVDQAEVTVETTTTTTTEETTTTTTEEVVEETTTTEEVVEETTTTEEVVEETTTTTEEVVEETTTTEEVVEETTTTTEEVVEETTTTEEVVEETTTTEEVVEETTTTEEVVEEPAEEEQLIFKVEEMNIDRWSFVVGDEEEPDRTEVISDVTIRDRRVTINLTEMLQQGAMSPEQMEQMTTISQEEAEEQLEENLTQDIETVRFVIRDVTIENVTFVITAPEDVELPEPPMTTTVEETTTVEVVEETTTTEEVFEETTTTEEVVEETTTTTEEVVEETTTTEEVVEETTTTEEVVEETTTEEVVEETTTTEEVVEETTTTTTEEPADLESFEVSNLDAPESATVGDTITVSATVANPNDQEATQEVAFRLEGTVIARQSVTLDAGEQTTVRFSISLSDVPAGQYIHGIYTRDFGDLAVITLEEPTTETTTTEEEEETTTVEVTTTAEA